MIKQYLAIKEKYQDAILFYRMGDFYEMFFEDAVTASRALDITLTSRNKKDNDPVPMCGVPFRAAQAYIAKLIGKGFKVAICDQIEDPKAAQGLVKREVVRVITPGMVVENELLDEKTNNFILSIYQSDHAVGLSYLDLSTSTFRITETKSFKTVLDELLRVAPREMLLPESLDDDRLNVILNNGFNEWVVTRITDAEFSFHTARSRLLEQFNTLNLEGFGCEQFKAGVGAAGALLHYVRETQKQAIQHLESVETYHLEHFLWVDDQSCRNLELISNIRTGSRKGTLIDVMDKTATALGARLLTQWLRYPLISPKDIESRLDAVQDATDRIPLTREIRQLLKSVHDLQRLRSKVTMGHANARDLTALKISIGVLPQIRELLSGFRAPLYQCEANIPALIALSGLIDGAIREDAPPTINEGGIIKPGYNAELDELIRISRDGKGWLAELEAREKQNTGINSLKVRYNKVFGYYIEVSKLNSELVPAHYVRKQTLVNAERYITDELKDFESKVLSAEDQRATMEYRIFNEVRDDVVKNGNHIQSAADFVARVDCLLNLGEIADVNNYSRPRLNGEGRISVTEGRHPVIEKMISGEQFVPNSIQIDNDEQQVIIITGPNMAGKSTILRQVALLSIMTQLGSFIPVQQADMPVIDRIFTRVGALDNLSAGQSTFMVEMQETANILNNATTDSLVIMDEIGRGTSTYDGMSIAWAVSEYLHDLNDTGVKTLFATHYHELMDLALTKERVKNYNIAVKEWNDEIIFLRKLVEGGTNRSYGIQVARLAGIPESVIKRSKKILSRIESDSRESAVPEMNAINAEGHKGHRQLSLFKSPEQALIENLKSIDIAHMTPMDAMNQLNELIQRLNEITN